MMSLLVTWFSNLHFCVELRIDYQPVKFQCCRLSVASFIDGLRKNNDDVIMTSYHEFECPVLLPFFCSFHSCFHYFSP